jgi:hypothetical protein
VILYRDNGNRLTPPDWIAGAPGLVVRESMAGRFWAIGESYLCGPQERNRWADVGDGFSATIVGNLDALRLKRDQQWCEVSTGPDLKMREWTIPKPLGYEGSRTFRVAYGPDYLPALTDEQKRCEDIARAARGALMAATLNGEPLPMKIACAWTAELLSVTNHVTPRVLGELALIDDVLVAAVLYGASGLSPNV